jgi:hypothetical protein
MSKITITFTEEGHPPVSVELTEATTAVLNKYVQDSIEYDEEGNPKQKYSGKAELFLQHTQKTLIEPLISSYSEFFNAETVKQIKALEEQKQHLELRIKSQFVPKIVVPQ